MGKGAFRAHLGTQMPFFLNAFKSIERPDFQ